MIWAFHGFLGQGRDWNFLREHRWKKCLAPEICTPNLFAQNPAQPGRSLEEEGRAWAQQITDCDPEPWLIGYSYGGRLALHILEAGLRAPTVLASTGLGLNHQGERDRRVFADEFWADRFERDEWSEVLRDWNAQSVLSPGPAATKKLTASESSVVLERSEGSYSRAALTDSLRYRGLGRQKNFMLRGAQIHVPTLWIVGDRDEHYLGETVKALNSFENSRSIALSGAGHRAPFEQPEIFCNEIETFFFEQNFARKG